MRLIHYSGEPISYLDKRDYDQTELTWQDKPNGLWISVEGLERLQNSYNWKEWCEVEEYGIENLAYPYEIQLHKNANILHLKSSQEIFEFTKLYPFLRDQWNNPKGRELCETYELDWNKVKEKYQGIIIAPYQWECRLALESCWYYGWDCASGCIWDISCIKEFKHMKKANENE